MTFCSLKTPRRLCQRWLKVCNIFSTSNVKFTHVITRILEGGVDSLHTDCHYMVVTNTKYSIASFLFLPLLIRFDSPRGHPNPMWAGGPNHYRGARASVRTVFNIPQETEKGFRFKPPYSAETLLGCLQWTKRTSLQIHFWVMNRHTLPSLFKVAVNVYV